MIMGPPPAEEVIGLMNAGGSRWLDCRTTISYIARIAY